MGDSNRDYLAQAAFYGSYAKLVHRPKPEEPKPPHLAGTVLFAHYKAGAVYILLAADTMLEGSGERLVTYMNTAGERFTRPYAEFFGLVGDVPRFRPLRLWPYVGKED